MRAYDGFSGSAGVAFLAGGARAGGCDNFEGCKETGGAGGLGLLNLDARIGAVFADHFGLTFGLYGPGFRNSKNFDWHSLLVSYLQASFQNDWISFALGPEVGSAVIGATAGLDVQPFGVPKGRYAGWDPAITAYGRYLTPYRVQARVASGEADARVPSWDVGGGIRLGFIVLQYGFWRATRGVIDYVIWETSTRAQSWHTVLVGVELNRRTLQCDWPWNW
jgi:hypothetical protein